jgi:hypothetical protein
MARTAEESLVPGRPWRDLTWSAVGEPRHSDAFDAAVHAEYRALAASLGQQRERAERLQELADHARAQAERDEQALVSLAQVLGLDSQMCIDSLDERLRGQRLQEIAIRVLAERHVVGQPVHYKEWYGLLREAGYSVGGKEPLASFLATISRSPKVRAVGQRSGLYVLIGGTASPAMTAPGASQSSIAA